MVEPDKADKRPALAEGGDSQDKEVTKERTSGSTQSNLPPPSSASGSATPEAADPHVSAELANLGPYQLLEKLGEGGMGAVYKAWHTRLKRLVAVKVLPPQLTRNAAALARFEREMEAVGRLEHPHIVRAMDADVQAGTHYLVMEYVAGQDLRQLVKQQGPLAVSQACRLLQQAAQALAHAHQHGLVHRDLKPSNLIVTPEGQLKVLDLGLARLGERQADDEELTDTGVAMGTPDYMAPEQWIDTHSVDHRCDVYALGCTLFYVLTGRAPFGDKRHGTSHSKMAAHTTEAAPSLAAANPGVPPALEQLYQRLMAKSAEERLGSAAELARLLQPFVVDDGGQPSRVTSGPAKSSTSPLSHAQTETFLPAQKPSASRSLYAQRLALIALLALAAIGVVFALGKLRPKPLEPAERPATSNPSNLRPSPGDDASAPARALAPFSAEEAAAHQAAWAEHLGVPGTFTNSLGMEFVLIPPGEFLMGSTPDEIDEALRRAGKDKHWQDAIRSEGPQHRVRLTRPFFLGRFEVTQQEYKEVMQVNPAHFSPVGPGKELVKGLDTSRFPVDTVSWFDAVEFCTRLKDRDKLTAKYIANDNFDADEAGYRLPTEAEWEFACRAGTTTRFYTGDRDEDLPTAAWFAVNSVGRTHAVGELAANAFGLYDMHGNVWEWVQDGWDAAYYRQLGDKPISDPSGPTSANAHRIMRGGHCLPPPVRCRSSARDFEDPAFGDGRYGFRVVLSVDAVKTLHQRQQEQAAP